MNRPFCIALGMGIGFASATDSSAAFYGWTVSKSEVNPLVNSGSPNGGVDTLFLWFFCSTEGMSAAQITLGSVPHGQLLSLSMTNGYLNAGNTTNLLLAVGGCPTAPLVAASILVLHSAPLAVCLGGQDVTFDCSPTPQPWWHFHKGYVDLGLPLCIDDFVCHLDATGVQSWGSIKSLYR